MSYISVKVLFFGYIHTIEVELCQLTF